MTIRQLQRKINTRKSITMGCCWMGLLLLVGFQTCTANPTLRSRNLIIGGSTVAGNRYPYFVALKDSNRKIKCGGSLIAPDMVLTAAHCRNSNLMYADVGKYSNTGEGVGEEIEILNPFEMISSGNWSTVRNLEKANATILDFSGFIHPLHDLSVRTWDVMLIKLAKPASPNRPIVKINTNTSVPVKENEGEKNEGKNEITIIGFGNIENTGFWPTPDTLKQVHVDYMPYDKCVDVEYRDVDYKFEVLPHMICASGNGIYGDRGQCYGDSGGPYILRGDDETGSEDVQVGLVSWAVNCASEFPMVGSRTSESAHFIKEVTCSVSSNPPSYLCAKENNSVDESLVSRFVPGGVKVSVRIFSDAYGHELKWKISDLLDESIVYAEAPYGKIVEDHSFQDVIVPVAQNLKFKIDDAADDGSYGAPEAILYEVVLVDSGVELVMVEGNGQFGTSREEIFQVPQLNDEDLAIVRASKVDAASDQVARVTGPTAPLKIYIEFADYHEDASWTVTSLDGSETFAFKNANDYRYGNDVTETVNLAAGQYKFTIKDRRGTDEFRAFNFFKLSYLDRQQRNGLGGETMVFQSEGLFHGEESSTEFSIPISATADTAGSSSSPEVIIGDASFLEEAEIDLGNLEEAQIQPILVEARICKDTNKYCTSHDQCCSNDCMRFKCSSLDDVDVYSTRVEQRVRGSTAGGAARGQGYTRA